MMLKKFLDGMIEKGKTVEVEEKSLLKQAFEFDASKIRLGQFISIAHQNSMYNAMITNLTERRIEVFVFVNSKFTPNKFQQVEIDVRDVSEIDTGLGPIPVFYVQRLSVNKSER